MVPRRYSRKKAHSGSVTPENSVTSVPDTFRRSTPKGPPPLAGCFAPVRIGGGDVAAHFEVASGRATVCSVAKTMWST